MCKGNDFWGEQNEGSAFSVQSTERKAAGMTGYNYLNSLNASGNKQVE